jgi:S-DNA-T family DNA segregation ATPase FtsK/SpoIIIE
MCDLPVFSLGDATETCRKSAHLVPELPALRPFRPDVPVRPPVETPGPVVRPRPVTD